MEENKDLDQRIEEVLSTPVSIDFDENFNDRIFLKIDRLEAKSKRSEWLAYAMLVGLFGLVFLAVLMLFVDSVSSRLLTNVIPWILVVGGVFVVFQLIENRFIKQQGG
ncbi:MAG: hypothetical protein JXR10_09615 [Cyclobacteriaceae bacterium]